MQSDADRMAKDWMAKIWEDMKLNHAKRSACKRHFFDSPEIKLGVRLICQNCGGEMMLSDVGFYISGYEAAGGNANDIIPGYRTSKER